MYLFKKDTNIKINKTKASREIGISRVYLSNVLNCKVYCTKPIAYSITKFLNNKALIEDYFVKKGE